MTGGHTGGQGDTEMTWNLRRRSQIMESFANHWSLDFIQSIMGNLGRISSIATG